MTIVFEHLRRSFEDLLIRATKPEDRREIVSRMKDTLVQARLGLDDLRDGLAKTQRKLEAERRELLTVKRRKELALGINDKETVTIAERFEKQHVERVTVLEEKILVVTREVDIAEREVEEMKVEIRRAMAAPASAASFPQEDPLVDPQDVRAREELDAMARNRARADRDDDAARRLEELKRKMGK
ncbi:MAG: hypothetical protein ACREOK_12740 [Gemmatimonadaceae bacterium]